MNLDSLFEAARQDGPTEEQKKASWNEIAHLTGAATVAVAAKSSVGAKALALKVVLVSALAITAGGAALSAAADPAPSHAAVTSGDGVGGRETHVGRMTMMDTVAVDNRARAVDDGVVVGMPTTDKPHAPRDTAERADEDESGLAVETRLVTEARAAVVRGDAVMAMRLLRKAKALKTRALEPEELALEARAARALGRVDDAEAAELRLKSRFPEHALAH